MITFHLVTGFLGSGKTTLLKRILEKYSEEKRIAIIQNEFAPTSTDGKELALSGAPFKLVEINNGSVFCVCKLGSFVKALAKVIVEYKPDLIFLEASGLSDPISILELLQDNQIKDKIQLAQIFTIVDALNFTGALQLLNRTRHQVMIADVILINKTDQELADVEMVYSMVKKINPFAHISQTSYCSLDLDDYILRDVVDHLGAEEFRKKMGGRRPSLTCCVLRVNKVIAFQALQAFVKQLQKSCPRIKGYVNVADAGVLMLQSVFDDFTFKTVEAYVGPSEIVAFGEGLTPGKLKDLFYQFVE